MENPPRVCPYILPTGVRCNNECWLALCDRCVHTINALVLNLTIEKKNEMNSLYEEMVSQYMKLKE